jgi:hypothetical protein
MAASEFIDQLPEQSFLFAFLVGASELHKSPVPRECLRDNGDTLQF